MKGERIFGKESQKKMDCGCIGCCYVLHYALWLWQQKYLAANVIGDFFPWRDHSSHLVSEKEKQIKEEDSLILVVLMCKQRITF